MTAHKHAQGSELLIKKVLVHIAVRWGQAVAKKSGQAPTVKLGKRKFI